MKIDIQLFLDILGFDSTSGSELLLSQFLEKRLAQPVGGRSPRVQAWDLEDGSRNLLFSWGRPRVVFCTHMDTVPPYIAPRVEGERIWGRGSCDAKGQLMSLYSACTQLVSSGEEGFGLLLLSGEETGSWGAKAFARLPFEAPYLIIGEPSENKMISASKGTKAFRLSFEGKPFHSGYPQFGYSAVDAFTDFVNALRNVSFEEDPVLGSTTWNIGRLLSDNPQNVLSPELSCRLYFRTTPATDALVSRLIPGWADGSVSLDGTPLAAAQSELLPWQKAMRVEAVGGDAPSEYLTIPGFDSAPAAFGSDAPHLKNFGSKAICGPGSIRFAHREDEHIDLPEMEEAVDLYVAMFKALK